MTITERQERKWGSENQEKIKKSLVTIIGTETLSNFVLSSLVGLGIGNIRIIGNKNYNGNPSEFLLFDFKKDINKIKKSKALEKIVNKINENTNGLYIEIDGISSNTFYDFVGNPNAIVDLSNNPKTKMKSIELSNELNVPLITASTSESRGRVLVYNQDNKMRNSIEDYLLLDFEGSNQGIIPSGVISGLVVEEVRKSIFKLNDYDKTIKTSVNYNLLSKIRSNKELDVKLTQKQFLNNKNILKNKKIGIIGAGAIGTFVSLESCLLNPKGIYIIDMDHVEETNKNRQILYCLDKSDGRKKVDATCEILKKINPNVESHPVYGKVGNKLNQDEIKKGVYLINEKELLNLNCDIILGCLDNFMARKFLNDFAVKNSIPYIDGGTSSDAGQLINYFPGKTACLECQIDLSKRLSDAIKRDNDMRTSCPNERHQPSVVMSNEIIGSAMVGEMRNYFCPEVYGGILISKMNYNSNNMDCDKIYAIPSSQPKENCNCFKLN